MEKENHSGKYLSFYRIKDEVYAKKTVVQKLKIYSFNCTRLLPKKRCKKTLLLTSANFKTVQINFVIVFCHPRRNFYLMMKYRKRAKKSYNCHQPGLT